MDVIVAVVLRVGAGSHVGGEIGGGVVACFGFVGLVGLVVMTGGLVAAVAGGRGVRCWFSLLYVLARLLSVAVVVRLCFVLLVLQVLSPLKPSQVVYYALLILFL